MPTQLQAGRGTARGRKGGEQIGDASRHELLETQAQRPQRGAVGAHHHPIAQPQQGLAVAAQQRGVVREAQQLGIGGPSVQGQPVLDHLPGHTHQRGRLVVHAAQLARDVEHAEQAPVRPQQGCGRAGQRRVLFQVMLRAHDGDGMALGESRADGIRAPAALRPVDARHQRHALGLAHEGVRTRGIEDQAVGVGQQHDGPCRSQGFGQGLQLGQRVVTQTPLGLATRTQQLARQRLRALRHGRGHGRAATPRSDDALRHQRSGVAALVEKASSRQLQLLRAGQQLRGRGAAAGVGFEHGLSPGLRPAVPALAAAEQCRTGSCPCRLSQPATVRGAARP